MGMKTQNKMPEKKNTKGLTCYYWRKKMLEVCCGLV